jgi:protocatechuate 3,4-dioxygenase beta subunit
MNTCHDHTGTTNFDLTTAERAIFTSNATTALTPETLIGPYFVTGEVIRRNLTENQVGVPIHLDIQFIDMNTCEPVPSMLVDIWHCNATGAYSGVAAAGEGGLNSTFLRGVQTTDKDGVIQIDSIFPGHYDGRANHVHVLSRRGGTILPNNTYVGGTVNHVGQLYFDKDLVSEIESFYPYNTNKILRTTNEVDSFVPDESTAYTDPLVDYIKLSSDANDGLLMWMTIGINMTADYNGYVDAAAYHYVDGGVANPAATAIPFPPKHGIWPPWYPSIDPSGNIIKPTQTSTAKPWGPCFNKKQH